MVAKKQSEVLQGSEKEFLDEFQKICYSRSGWQVWSDLMTVMACSISNAVDKSKEHFEQREKEYAACIKRLGSVEIASKMFAIIVMALEQNPEQDFLGKMYMALNLSNHWKGQFFTPYSVCQLMAESIIGDSVQKEIDEKGYLAVNDPACGAGATLIATANIFHKKKINYQNHVVFVAQDIDRVVGMMCYIQLSLLGCAGYVCIADTITNPLCGTVLAPLEKEGQELWYMPMFATQQWSIRRMIYSLGWNSGTETTQKTVEKEQFYMFFNFEKEEVYMETNRLNENDTQLESSIEISQTIYTGIAGAVAKLQEELKGAKAKEFAEPIINYLINRCRESESLADDVCQKHKTWEKCSDFIKERAMENVDSENARGVVAVPVTEDTVFEWSEDYYHKDDKAEEEKKAKEAAEKKKKEVTKKKEKAEKTDKSKQNKARADYDTTLKSGTDNHKLSKEEITERTVKAEKKAPKPKSHKKNNRDMDGQMDIFSIMGM